jgi:hypothetical protein
MCELLVNCGENVAGAQKLPIFGMRLGRTSFGECKRAWRRMHNVRYRFLYSEHHFQGLRGAKTFAWR